MIRFHVTAGALRSIDKAGGLDNYLMTSRHVEEGEGLKVKRRIMHKRRYLAYLERVKAAGAGTEGLTTIDEQGEENQENI